MVTKPAPLFTYVELSGLTIECTPPDPAIRDFMERARAISESTETTSEGLRKLIFSTDNPLLARHPVLGGAFPDARTVRSPFYWACVDLLLRVELRESGRSVDEIAAPFTMTVPDAAKALGRYESTIHNAISNRTLHAWVRNGRYYLLPDEVSRYDVPRRGRAPQKGKRR